MATFEYNDKIKFMLPSGFIFSRDEDDDGNEVVSIMAGEYTNDEGETCYNFNCHINYNEYDPEEADDELTSENLLDLLAEQAENSCRMKLPGKPETVLVNMGIPFSGFGCTMSMFAFWGLVRVSDWAVVQLNVNGAFYDDDSDENAAVYKNIYEVLKAIRVNGKKLAVDSVTPKQIQEALELTFEEDDPMSCYFSRPVDKEVPKARWEAERAEEWMRKYEKYLETNPVIDFNGTRFVFSGVAGRGAEKDDPIVQKVIEKGGQYRSKVSGLTNYLVVNPVYSGRSKIVDVMEQLQKGKNIKVILLEDLEKALGEKTATTTAESTSTKTSGKSGSTAGSSTNSTDKKSSSKMTTTVDKAAGLADTMSDLSAQITEMQNQELSDEDRDNLNDVMGQLSGLMDDLNEGQTSMGKYFDYLEQKETREKAQEEEKARKKAEAMAAGKSEKDIVNMYIILTNEKKLGKLHRFQDEFYEIYEEDFAALSKAEVIKIRKDMFEEMEDESLCSYYAESFKKRSVKERFSVSTRNLNNVSTEPELGVTANWAVENSKEWYQPSEYAEVRKLMDADLADMRKQLDDQFDSIDRAWKKFSTVKEFLLIVVTDKDSDGSDIHPLYSNFQVVIGGQLVSVRISSKGIVKMVTTVMNSFTWYWGVTVRDIWEAALRNEVQDECEHVHNGRCIAYRAIAQIRTEHPETKVTPIATGKSSHGMPEISRHTSTAQRSTTTTSEQQTASQPAKNEGCYIATAVYGSYDAPQVMTLRRFRDETLRNTAFGRWFVRTYYRLSPPVAEKLKNAKHINKFVRSILDKWVEKLNQKQQ